MKALIAFLLTSAALVGCADQTVTETGYFLPSGIGYTSPTPLSPVDAQEVIVVGEPGSVSEPGGMLLASLDDDTGNSAGIVDETTGSFVAVVTARLGDQLRLRYELDDRFDQLDIELTDDLSSVGQAICTTCTADGGIVTAPDADGNVLVMLDLLADPTPPFLILNQQRGAVVRADDTTTDVQLPGEVGDTVCVHRLDGELASPTLCELVPSPAASR